MPVKARFGSLQPHAAFQPGGNAWEWLLLMPERVNSAP